MKQFITPNYIFNPDIIGSGYIDLKNISNFDIRQLVAIINQTSGKVLYSTASESLKYLALSGSILYFNHDTSSDNSSDLIQIIYDADINMVDVTIMLRNLISILANPSTKDKSINAERVNVVTPISVTTVSTVSNIAALGGYQAQIETLNNNTAAWYSGCRSRIS